jgi:CBS domain containing-hemolysin-like protein
MTSGIVTMEDILEEIVGEINDEYDEEEKNYIRLDERVYIFEGKTPLDDFFDVIGMASADYLPEASEAETLAGFVLELMDELPVEHQKASCRRLSFEVLALDGPRISKIKVTIAEENATD